MEFGRRGTQVPEQRRAPEETREVSWNAWLQSVGRYMDNHMVLRNAVYASEPEVTAQLEQQMAEDRAVIVLFLQMNPHLHGRLQAMLMGAMQNANNPTGSAATTSVGADSVQDSDGSSYGSASHRPQDGRSMSQSAADSQSEGSTFSPASGDDLVEETQETPRPRTLLTSTLLLYKRWTTLAVYNIAKNTTQEQLVQAWPVDGSYDFLSLSSTNSLKKRAKVAYINFLTPELAARFHAQWERVILHSSKRPLVILAAPVQGRDANLMLTLNNMPIPPVIVIGGRAFEGEDSRALVRHSKTGMFVTAI